MLLGVGCIPTMQEIESDRRTRMAVAESGAEEELVSVRDDCKRQFSVEEANWKSEVIFPICDARVPPGVRCGLLIDKFQSDEEFARHAETCAPMPDESCEETYRLKYVKALRDRYDVFSPMGLVCPEGCSFQEYELEILRAHNEQVNEEHDRAFETIKIRCLERTAKIQKRLDRSQATIDAEAQARAIDADNDRERWRRFGDALQEMRRNLKTGCCSSHGGVCGCNGGRLVCCDGEMSPTCGGC